MTTEAVAAPAKPKRNPLADLIAYALANPFAIWLWSTLFGLLMCAASIALGVHSVGFNGVFGGGEGYRVAETMTVKEVGYLAALNWSVFGALILPSLLYFGLRALSLMQPTLSDIPGAGILRDEHFKPVPADAILASWHKFRGVTRGVFVTMFVVVTIYLTFDWWQVVGQPLLDPAGTLETLDLFDRSDDNRIGLNHPTHEFDWSVAPNFDGADQGMRGPIFVFGLIAYMTIATIASAFAFAFVVSAAVYCMFVQLRCGNKAWTYVANPKDPADRRFGWQVFEPFYTNLLAGVVTLLAGLWLMVLQNAYLRDPVSETIITFVVANGEAGLEAVQIKGNLFDTMGAVISWLIEPGRNNFTANPQVAFGVLLFPFAFVAAMVISWWMLRRTAANGKQAALSHVAELSVETGVPAEELEKRLEDMQYWPVGWLKEGHLFVLMTVLFLALISYRFALVVLAYLVIRLLRLASGILTEVIGDLLKRRQAKKK